MHIIHHMSPTQVDALWAAFARPMMRAGELNATGELHWVAPDWIHVLAVTVTNIN